MPSIEQRLQNAETLGYTSRDYVELGVNIVGLIAGLVLASAIVAHDPAAYLTYEPGNTSVSDTGFYALFGGTFLALVASAWLCGRNLLLRFVLVALWSAFAALLAVKFAAFLYSLL